jgi:choline dehydrogenase-like flavoprotein
VVSQWLDQAAERKGYKLAPVPRAILSRPRDDRFSCYYSNYCGSYGCGSNAKGSSRVALLDQALKTGRLTIVPYAKVFHLKTDGEGRVKSLKYHDQNGKTKEAMARIFVVAAQAIETSRLLLMSKNPEFPDGLANNNGQVGRNLLFSGGGTGGGHFYFDDLSEDQVQQLKMPGVFVNRSIHHWYEIDDPVFGKLVKGGMVDFLFEHANATTRAIRQKWNPDGTLLYGGALKKKLKDYFTRQRRLKFEVFVDWLPTDDCYVTLDPHVKDKWGDPVARVRLGYHEHDLKVGRFLAKQAEELLGEMGAKDIRSGISGGAPPNLQAGGCRFGTDPRSSVLDVNCRAHEVENLYVTDGSFMPTGGSVTYTWTIYANAFRVADKIVEQLKG